MSRLNRLAASLLGVAARAHPAQCQCELAILTSGFAFSHAVAVKSAKPTKAPAKRRPRSMEREELRPVAMPSPGNLAEDTQHSCNPPLRGARRHNLCHKQVVC